MKYSNIVVYFCKQLVHMNSTLSLHGEIIENKCFFLCVFFFFFWGGGGYVVKFTLIRSWMGYLDKLNHASLSHLGWSIFTLEIFYDSSFKNFKFAYLDMSKSLSVYRNVAKR